MDRQEKLNMYLDKIQFHDGNRFTGLVSNTKIENCNLSDYYFSKDVIDEKKIAWTYEFRNVIFEDVIFNGSFFKDFTFRNCVFNNCSFDKASFKRTSFIGCKDLPVFSKCQFNEVLFENVINRHGSNLEFSECEMSQVNIISQHKTDVQFRKCVVNSSEIKNATLGIDTVNNILKDVILDDIDFQYRGMFLMPFVQSNEHENLICRNSAITIRRGDFPELIGVSFERCDIHDIDCLKTIVSCKFDNSKIITRWKLDDVIDTNFQNCEIDTLLADKIVNTKFDKCKITDVLQADISNVNFYMCDLTSVLVKGIISQTSFNYSIIYPENFIAIIRSVDFTNVSLSSGLLKAKDVNYNKRYERRGIVSLRLIQLNIGLPLLGSITYCYNNNKVYSDFGFLLRLRVKSHAADDISLFHNFPMFREDQFQFGVPLDEMKKLIDKLYPDQLKINDSLFFQMPISPEEYYDDMRTAEEEMKYYYFELVNAYDYFVVQKKMLDKCLGIR